MWNGKEVGGRAGQNSRAEQTNATATANEDELSRVFKAFHRT